MKFMMIVDDVKREMDTEKMGEKSLLGTAAIGAGYDTNNITLQFSKSKNIKDITVKEHTIPLLLEDLLELTKWTDFIKIEILEVDGL